MFSDCQALFQIIIHRFLEKKPHSSLIEYVECSGEPKRASSISLPWLILTDFVGLCLWAKGNFICEVLIPYPTRGTCSLGKYHG